MSSSLGGGGIPPIELRADGGEAFNRVLDEAGRAAERLGQRAQASGQQLGALATGAESSSRVLGALQAVGTAASSSLTKLGGDFATIAPVMERATGAATGLLGVLRGGAGLVAAFGAAGAAAGAAYAIFQNWEPITRALGTSFDFLTGRVRLNEEAVRDAAEGVRAFIRLSEDAAERARRLYREGMASIRDQANASATLLEANLQAQQTSLGSLTRGARVGTSVDATIDALQSNPNRSVADSAILETLLRQQSALRAEAAATAARLDRDPEVLRVRGEVAMLERQIAGQRNVAALMEGRIAASVQDGSSPNRPPAPRSGRGGSSRERQSYGPLDGSNNAWMEWVNQQDEAQKRAAENERQVLERREEQNRRVTDRIVDYGAERFADLFDENGQGWDGMWDAMERTAKSTIARIAAEAVIRPVIAPIVQSLGLGGLGSGNGGMSGLFGLGSIFGGGGGGFSLGGFGAPAMAGGSMPMMWSAGPAGAGGVAAAQGGDGSLDLFGLARTGSSLYSNLSGGGGSSWLGGLSGYINNPIWQSGAGWFASSGAGATNAALAGMGAGVYGPAAPAAVAAAQGSGGMLSTLGSVSLGTYAAGIGGGYMLGTTFGNMIAKTDAQRTNVQIGSGVGAVGGAAAGAMIGSIIPGVGTAIGALVGGLVGGSGGGSLGGLIGPSRQFSGGDVGIGLADNGHFSIVGAGGKRWDEWGARASVQEAIDPINQLLGATGVRVTDSVRGAAGLWGAVDIVGSGMSPNSQFDPQDLFGRVRGNLTANNANLETALRAGTVGSWQEIETASQFITQIYEPMLKAKEAGSQFEQTLKTIADSFAPAIDGAQRWGLSIDALSAAQAKQTEEAYAARSRADVRAAQGLDARRMATGGRAFDASIFSFDIQTEDERRALEATLTDLGIGEGSGLRAERLSYYDVVRGEERASLYRDRDRQLTGLGTAFEMRRLGALGTPDSMMQAFDLRATAEMEELRTALKALGAASDDVRVSMLASAQATERDVLLKQQQDQKAGTARDLLLGLTVGGGGGLAPEARYFAGLQAYNQARQSGDINQLSSVAQTFLPVARDYLGTSERFAALTAGFGRDIAALGGDQYGLSALLDVQAGSTAALERIFDMNGLALDEMKGMRGDINRLLFTLEALIARR
ncbi:hypothetical protein GXW78_07525 [Roseomonas terrae]|uniref:Bacteriophage tail tape measure N-terminal domain-containing protein n=1 Tax=Neoroseomonas terrae TaxID=424799 RepID=A0ABS5EEQ0_9PROT|nr:hypothetical protein [Neoroseomonas terrae]MBR0649504.1 hypothetical protein [Neoroseomonas terrae]